MINFSEKRIINMCVFHPTTQFLRVLFGANEKSESYYNNSAIKAEFFSPWFDKKSRTVKWWLKSYSMLANSDKVCLSLEKICKSSLKLQKTQI